MYNPVLIFGANYLGRSAKEIFEMNGNVVYGFLDDTKHHGKEIGGAVVVGDVDDDKFIKLVGKKCEAFIAFDDNRLRKKLVETLQNKAGVQPVNAIHPRSLLSAEAIIGHGNFIDANVIIGPGAGIGSFCLIHAGVIVQPESHLGNYIQVGSGTLINTGVTVEDDVFIGSGVTLVSGLTIGKGARIGAGSVVIESVKPGDTVFGNPATVIKG